MLHVEPSVKVDQSTNSQLCSHVIIAVLLVLFLLDDYPVIFQLHYLSRSSYAHRLSYKTDFGQLLSHNTEER